MLHQGTAIQPLIWRTGQQT